MDTREVLRPYRNKRLVFEGVLIDVIKPNVRNDYTYGLVFGSVYAPHENIELDHAVIRIECSVFRSMNLTQFKRYRFTACVGLYYKVVTILGADVLQENCMLEKLNAHKIREIHESQLPQPTQYVMNRIYNVLCCKSSEIEHTEEQLLDIVFHTPNDGSIEKFMDNYARRYQHRKLNEYEMLDILYPTGIPQPVDYGETVVDASDEFDDEVESSKTY